MSVIYDISYIQWNGWYLIGRTWCYRLVFRKGGSQNDGGEEKQREEAAEQFVSTDVGKPSEIHMRRGFSDAWKRGTDTQTF